MSAERNTEGGERFPTSGEDHGEHGEPLRALPRRPKRIPRELRKKYGDHYDRKLEAARAGALISNVLAANHVHADIRDEMLFAEWPQFVGERIGSRTRPREIVGGHLLVIEVASSTWLHELRLLKQKLVMDLMSKLGPPPLFTDIRLVLAGERPRRDTEQRGPGTPRPPARVKKPPRPAPKPAAGMDAIRILEETKHVADDELRALIAKVRIENDK